METFGQLVREVGITAAEVSELLSVPPERAAKYVDGSIKPSSRELHVLKGILLARGARPNVRSSSPEGALRAEVTSRHSISVQRPAAAKKNQSRKSLRGGIRKSHSKLRTLELCAGAGGAALGLEQAGFEPDALIEIDSHACATLRRNRPYWNVIQADMRRFEASYWRGVDLLSGGLPCPPFSIAGKQLGSDDERDMFPHMLRIVKEVQPRAVLIENVRGILTSKFTPFRNKVDSGLDAEGFDTYWMGFNASEFGVPQMRFRAFLIGLRRGETKPLRWPLPMSNTGPTVSEAISDLMGAKGWTGLAEWKKKANSPAPTIVGGSHKMAARI